MPDLIRLSRAGISPERSVYDQGSTVKIGGHIKDVWDNVLSSFPVVVSIRNSGYTRVLTTTTDGNGDYSVTFAPASGEADVYDMGVRHPDIVGEAATSSFTIVGFGLNYGSYSVSMRQGSGYSFDVTLKNSGGNTLQGLAYAVDTVSSDGITVSVPQGLSTTLAAGAQTKVTLTCAAGSTATSGSFVFKVTDGNGFTRSMQINATAVAPTVTPQVTPQLFSMGVVAGDSKTQAVTVYNVGYATWTNVNVTRPTLDWVSVEGLSGLYKSLGDIAPGGNVNFTLNITPPSTQASSAYAQNPLVSLVSDNYAAVPVNAAITVTASKSANIYFTVVNADKLVTDATRFIENAAITLTSLDIAGLSLTAKSNSAGYAALAAVPSGKYSYTVSASGTQGVSGNITVEPGIDQNLNMVLPTSMVTYTWSVTPTTITDNYNVQLDVTYKTDVAAPAVVVSPVLETIAMTDGQTVYTQYTITNKGLVAVKNFTLDATQSDPAVTVEIPFTSIDEIAAGQTITVPVKIYLEHASTHEAVIRHKGGYMCAAGVWTDLAVETWKAVVGSVSNSGNSSSGTSGTASTTVGGSGSGGNTTSTSYSGVGSAVTEVVVSKTTANSVCGTAACKNNSDCSPCKVCNVGTGLCEASTSKTGFVANSEECGGSLCQKEVCKIDGTSECVEKNGTEKFITNNSVSAKPMFNDLDSSKCANRVNLPNPKGDQICTSPAASELLIIAPSVPPLTVVPKNCGRINLTPICQIHDNEYGTCGISWWTANNNFLTNLITECNRVFSGDVVCIDACLSVAGAYYMGVHVGAFFGFYEDSHRAGCRCCPGEEPQ